MALGFVALGWGLAGIWWAICLSSILKGLAGLIWLQCIRKKDLKIESEVNELNLNV
jgi:Na+-driven multidrug efflux pump